MPASWAFIDHEALARFTHAGDSAKNYPDIPFYIAHQGLVGPGRGANEDLSHTERPSDWEESGYPMDPAGERLGEWASLLWQRRGSSYGVRIMMMGLKDSSWRSCGIPNGECIRLCFGQRRQWVIDPLRPQCERHRTLACLGNVNGGFGDVNRSASTRYAAARAAERYVNSFNLTNLRSQPLSSSTVAIDSVWSWQRSGAPSTQC